MSAKALLNLFASVLFHAGVVVPSVALAQLPGPPPGPPPGLAGPPPGSLPVVLRRDLSLAFRPAAP